MFPNYVSRVGDGGLSVVGHVAWVLTLCRLFKRDGLQRRGFEQRRIVILKQRV